MSNTYYSRIKITLDSSSTWTQNLGFGVSSCTDLFNLYEQLVRLDSKIAEELPLLKLEVELLFVRSSHRSKGKTYYVLLQVARYIDFFLANFKLKDSFKFKTAVKLALNTMDLKEFDHKKAQIVRDSNLLTIQRETLLLISDLIKTKRY